MDIPSITDQSPLSSFYRGPLRDMENLLDKVSCNEMTVYRGDDEGRRPRHELGTSCVQSSRRCAQRKWRVWQGKSNGARWRRRCGQQRRHFLAQWPTSIGSRTVSSSLGLEYLCKGKEWNRGVLGIMLVEDKYDVNSKMAVKGSGARWRYGRKLVLQLEVEEGRA